MWLKLIPFILFLAFRFYDIGARPPHHDEAVNGWFVDGLLNRGYYIYDPQNYHGPLFFYILALFKQMFGRSIEVLRLPTLIFGSLITITPFLFRRWIGNAGAWIAALFFTLSPAMIFYSRYTIHETLFALSCILFFYAWLKVRTASGKALDVVTLGLSLGAMASLKENFVLFGASLVFAELALFGIQRKTEVAFTSQVFKQVGVATLIGVSVMVLCFTGGFQDDDGIAHFFKAFSLWFETGEKGNGHAKPFYYWLKLMGMYEWFALIGLFSVPFLYKKMNGVLKLLSLTTAMLWLMYSLVAYKTPWCVLSFEWGLILISGYLFGILWEKKQVLLVILTLTAGLSVSVGQAWDVAYENPDQEGHLFIYGQTFREFMGPVNELIARGNANPELRKSLRIEVISAFTWPLPYLLGEFKSVGYFGEANAPQVIDGDVVIMDQNFEQKFKSRITGNYVRTEVKSRQWALPSVFLIRSP